MVLVVNMTTEVTTVRAEIRGRVQGVNYRMWTQAQARILGLAGWVRNRADGSVEATFQGPASAVSAMLDACRVGPAHAIVESVVAEPWPQMQETDFVRFPTV